MALACGGGKDKTQMGGLISFLLTKRFESLSVSRYDSVENALCELALPNYVEHLTNVTIIMA